MKLKLLTFLSSTLDEYGRGVFKGWNGNKNSKIAKDTRTAIESAPFGIDGNPIKGTRMIWARTEVDGAETILGVWNVNRVADTGEARIFSMDADQNTKFNFWCRAAGEGLIGDSDDPGDYTNYAVLFNELKTEFNKLKTDYNNLVTTFNAHTHILTLSAGTGTAAPSVTQGSSNTSNIDNAKNAKLKYNS